MFRVGSSRLVVGFALLVVLGAHSTASSATRSAGAVRFQPLIETDPDRARLDLLDALGAVDGTRSLPLGIDPSRQGYTEHFQSSGLAASPDALAAYAASIGDGLETVDAPMLRVLADQALPMFVGYIHALETVEKGRPLTGEEAAGLLDAYQTLWTYAAMYPTPGEVSAVEEGLKIELDPLVHQRSAWADPMRIEIWGALRYRYRMVIEGKQPVARGEVELAGELAAAARTWWRSEGSGEAARLYVAAARYVAALDPTEKRKADVVLTSVHVGGLKGMPKKKQVPAEVRNHESYARVVDVVEQYEEIETLRGDESPESKLRAARLLYLRDREAEARGLALTVAVELPGHAEALTRLAGMHAEGAPRLARDVLETADPTGESLAEDSLVGHFSIRWVAVFIEAAQLGRGGAEAVRRVDARLADISMLVESAGDKLPVSRSYSLLLADALRQLWVEELAIEDMDLSVHIPLMKDVLATNPDEHLFLLLLFATRLSPGVEEFGLLQLPLGEAYSDEARCSLHTDRSRSVIAAAVHGLEAEEQLDAIAAEIEATADSCGEGPTTSKLRGDLVVLRTIHASQPPALDDAIPLYEVCAHSIDRQEASICRGNLFVIHHVAGRTDAARDAMDALWGCCLDQPPTMYHALFAVGDDKLPGAEEWLQTARRAEETRNEPERLYMCAGDIARRTGDESAMEQYWRQACVSLEDRCDEGEGVLDVLPGLFLGNGAMTLHLTGRSEAPIHVGYEQYLRLMGNCDAEFTRWVQQGGCSSSAGE